VLDQKHSHSVLGDKPYSYFKAYFWIGAKAINHQSKVEKTMTQLDDVVSAHPSDTAKLRVYIEYQFSESFEFFTLFDKINSGTAKPGE